MKPCKCCGKECAASDFYAQPHHSSGLAGVCKTCWKRRSAVSHRARKIRERLTDAGLWRTVEHLSEQLEIRPFDLLKRDMKGDDGKALRTLFYVLHYRKKIPAKTIGSMFGLRTTRVTASIATLVKETSHAI